MTSRKADVLRFLNSKIENGQWVIQSLSPYFAYKTGIAITKIYDIAEALGRKREDIVKALELLEADGYLKVEPVRDQEGRIVKETLRSGRGNHKRTWMKIEVMEVRK